MSNCSYEMDVDLECTQFLGEYFEIKTIDVNESVGCNVELKSNVDQCHPNRDQFLKLAYFDPLYECYSLNGIENNVVNTIDSNAVSFISHHMSSFVYVDYIPITYQEW